MNKESPISIQDAHHLMEVLDKDIPECDKRRVALLLLILSANHKLAEKGDVVGYSPRTSIKSYGGYYGYTDEELMEQCYGC